MEVRDTLAALGGTASTAELRRVHTRRQVEAAADAGRILRVGRGRYALRAATEAQQAAARLHGTASHLSAAQLHRWQVLRDPRLPWVTVPRNRKTDGITGVHLAYGAVDGPVTAPLRTVLDCGRRVAFADALAVTDSALRSGAVGTGELVAAAARLRGPGAGRARRVAAEARAEAANPLESGLRAIALDVPGLAVEPQLAVDLGRFTAHPDLLDRRLGIAVEAEGAAFHGTLREMFHRDVERYTLMVAHGLVVLRFTHPDVLTRPEHVRDCLLAVVAERTRHLGCRA